MKNLFVLLMFVMTSCKPQEHFPIPRASFRPNDDIVRNKSVYETLKMSSNPENILDAIEFADYFNDSTYLFKTIENSNKAEYLVFDFLYHTTPGERAFSKILDGEKFVKTDHKISLCLRLLSDPKYYHVHDLAGSYISKLLGESLAFNDFFDKYLRKKTDNEIGYVLIRVNQNCEDDFTEGFTLSEEQENQAMEYIKNERCSDSVKTYLLDYLYSVNYSVKRGELLHDKVKYLTLDRPVLHKNEMLYQHYIATKPLFEKLDSIQTWMEMDKNFANIKILLNNDSPIIFLQILKFNPSTVLKSKALCRRKIKTIRKIVFETDPGSFFSIYKMILRNELDLKDNNDVRFISDTYTAKQFERLKNKLINK